MHGIHKRKLGHSGLASERRHSLELPAPAAEVGRAPLVANPRGLEPRQI